MKKGEGVIGRRGGAVIEPFGEHDEVIVSGYMLSVHGPIFIRRLRGTIGCRILDADGMFKVWPCNEEHHRLDVRDGRGGPLDEKLWFDANDQKTEVKVIEEAWPREDMEDEEKT